MVPKNTIEYQAFSSETIVLVGGNEINASEFAAVESNNNLEATENWLKTQKWYGTTGDMEHLRRFWQLNFNKYADFRPNYIVPNLNSIVRCLSSGKGLAVVPDFLCKKEIDNQQIQLIWKGKVPLENTLYFATRKKTMYVDEINLIKKIFIEVM
jgi:DNA-binding transcriptional LysR family regulator